METKGFSAGRGLKAHILASDLGAGLLVYKDGPDSIRQIQIRVNFSGELRQLEDAKSLDVAVRHMEKPLNQRRRKCAKTVKH